MDLRQMSASNTAQYRLVLPGSVAKMVARLTRRERDDDPLRAFRRHAQRGPSLMATGIAEAGSY
jgi:hypothetical protein